MNFNNTKIIHGAVFLVAVLLSACGGGGGGTTAPAAVSYSMTTLGVIE